MADFNKFQYSYFLDNGAQVVVRTDDAEEFRADVATAQEMFPPTSTVKSSPQRVPVAQTENMCPVHNKELKEKVSKSTGKPYKAHFRKLGEEWDICFGKGWQSEREGDNIAAVTAKINAQKKEEDVSPDDIPF